jgi:HD superfamily phosphohydrolase
MMKEVQPNVPYEVIKDPIYGYIRLYEHEREIIDTPAFQRLRRLKQLSSAHYVYPSATHSRFSHSLGVMHISGIFLNRLLEPYSSEISQEEYCHYFFLIRLWGLTHDVGHGPFSHAFDSAVLQQMGLNHEYMSGRIVQENTEIAGIIEKRLANYGISPKTLSDYLVKSKEEWSDPRTLGKTEHNEAAFYHILKGFYSTDVIDYLQRDNLFTGAGYGNFDWQRLILSSNLSKDEVALDQKARDTLDSFLLSRLFSFNAIYYHRWSRAVDHIIKVFLTKARTRIDFASFTKDVLEYQKLDEESIFHFGELVTIPERDMLVNRKIPFRLVEEKRFPTSSLPFLSEDDLSEIISEKLKGDVPPEAYFIDTPNLPLCPAIGEEEICMIDTTTSPPTISHDPVRETSWGEVPHSIWTIRLFLDTRFSKAEEKIRDAFRAAVKGETKLKTHY